LYFAEPEKLLWAVNQTASVNPLIPTVANWYTYLVPDWLKPSFVIFDIGEL